MRAITKTDDPLWILTEDEYNEKLGIRPDQTVEEKKMDYQILYFKDTKNIQ